MCLRGHDSYWATGSLPRRSDPACLMDTLLTRAFNQCANPPSNHWRNSLRISNKQGDFYEERLALVSTRVVFGREPRIVCGSAEQRRDRESHHGIGKSVAAITENEQSRHN